MDGDRSLLKSLVGKIAFQKSPQSVGLDQMLASPQNPEQFLEAERKDMLALKPAPDSLELCNAGMRRLRGKIGAVDCSRRRPTMKSAFSPCSISARSIPTSTAPRLPPPART